MIPHHTRYKIVLLHNVVSPHVVPVLERLSAVPFIDLKVIFFTESESNRRWKVGGGLGFDHEIPPHLAVEFRGRDLWTYHFNPTVPYRLLREPFDAIISAGWDSFAAHSAFCLCKGLHRPFILWSGSTINEASWRRTFSLPLVKLMVRGADAYIAYGTRSKEYLVHLSAPEDKIFIAINTVDTDHFRTGSALARAEKARLKRELGIEGRKVILYTGQLIERKGIRYLLEAYGRLRQEHTDVGLLIVGYGPQERELKKLSVRAGIEDVHFVGHADIDEIPKYYGISDLHVLPATEEVWGLVINEAMACGLPVITTDKVGASADLVEHGVNGYVVKAGDTEELFGAMKRVIEAPTLRDRMAEASRRRISRFGLDTSVEGFLSAIEYVVTRSR